MNKEHNSFIDALCAAIRAAGEHQRLDQIAPAAVLWPDEGEQWLPLLPRLRSKLPLLTLGNYDPKTCTGPAIWMRCVLAGILDVRLHYGEIPVIYLPGVSRNDLRAVDECPRPLQPLAELLYRGVFFSQRNSRDWTVAAFIQTENGGLGLELSADTTTKELLGRALPLLADEPVAQLREETPLRASYFRRLLGIETPRNLSFWDDVEPG